MFSMYCGKKFEVEPVEVIYPDGKSCLCPDLSVYSLEVPLSYITDTIGVSLGADEVLLLLLIMSVKYSMHSIVNVAYWVHNMLDLK